VWLGVAIAVLQSGLLASHLLRAYPTIPKRVPLGLRFDGRPRTLGPKALLWLAPGILFAVIAVSLALFVVEPRAEEKDVTLLLVFLVMAEVAWLLQWTIDRQIELARGMTFRIAPMRLLLIVLPLLATIGVTIVVAAT
jgi:hypothetical protein